MRNLNLLINQCLSVKILFKNYEYGLNKYVGILRYLGTHNTSKPIASFENNYITFHSNK